MFDPINLDSLTTNPKDLRVLAEVLTSLALYAKHRAHAIDARRQGYLATAQTAQRNANAVYAILPEWAQW